MTWEKGCLNVFKSWLDDLWEDRYLVVLNLVKFSMAAVFIFSLIGLKDGLNENSCRYAVEFGREVFS